MKMQIYMKMPAAAGGFIYISVTSGVLEPSGAKCYVFLARLINHYAITAKIYWLPVFKPQDKFLIKLVHSSEKKLFDIKFLT